MTEYHYKSTSNQSSDLQDVELSNSISTRKIIRPTIAENQDTGRGGVKIDILHQRGSKESGKYVFEDIPSESLAKFKKKEIGKLSLSSAETRKLYDTLTELYKAYTDLGVPQGEGDIAVGFSDEIIRVDKSRADIIKKLIQNNHSKEVWEFLENENPRLATILGLTRIQQLRKNSLDKFKEMLLNSDLDESAWQEYFEKNKWIFGYGLDYRILKPVQDQPRYGGLTIDGTGINKGDFLAASEATVKFTALVEIKRPNTELLRAEKYRNDVFIPSKDLIGGVSQLRVNAQTWEIEGATSVKNRDKLESQSIYTVKPKCILVIGDTKELATERSMLQSFELFRQGQHDIDILTFDELLNRATFIVEHNEQKLVEISK